MRCGILMYIYSAFFSSTSKWNQRVYFFMQLEPFVMLQYFPLLIFSVVFYLPVP
uniref:Uncharacterized protein n=1 Tax=Rhizophora mucronata TaxID=61149 RepID=A0A2P2Q0V6_RHIMU